MRVNPNYTADVLTAVARTQQASADALLQMSSGKRVNTPSDDRAAAAAMVQLSTHADQVDQYLGNLTTMNNQMQAVDSTMSTVVTELNQAISAGIQGAKGTLSAANRQALADQVQGILSNIVSQDNLSYMGAFVFGGTASTTQPFTADATAPSGYKYNGNANQNSVPIGEGLSVQANLPGDQVFQKSGADVMGSLHDLVAALRNNDPTAVGNATSAVRSALDYVSQVRVFYGNNMTQMSQQQSYLQKEKTDMETQQNSLIGVDLATAATQFNQAQTAHSATLAAASRLMQNTLLDYLK